MAGSSATRINTIFLGEVASIQTYGAFVRIPGSSHQGLVHRTQISKVNVPDVSEVLSKGDAVWCKIINTTDDGKIGLSMKVVDQGSGKDLDPAGVQMQLDEQKRKEWVPGDKRKTISLEAVFNTTCSKCGTRGHLSKDCFQAAGGKTYDLLPEQDSRTVQTSSLANKDTLEELREKDKKREKKEAKKREKKAAKKKKKAAKKLKKKLKKEAKKAKKQKSKKKKKSSSDDSSDSSDSSSSSSSDSESDQVSNQKQTPQRNYPISNTHERRPGGLRSRSRSRSRSPVRGHRTSRTSSEFSRERNASMSLKDERKRRM